jgi:hypothetical protein
MSQDRFKFISGRKTIMTWTTTILCMRSGFLTLTGVMQLLTVGAYSRLGLTSLRTEYVRAGTAVTRAHSSYSIFCAALLLTIQQPALWKKRSTLLKKTSSKSPGYPEALLLMWPMPQSHNEHKTPFQCLFASTTPGIAYQPVRKEVSLNDSLLLAAYSILLADSR